MSYKGVKAGWYSRDDGRKVWARSGWERHWMAYLDWLVGLGEISSWEYEPQEFEYPVKRGTRFYKPDFRVVNRDGSVEWQEVKGRWTAKAKTQVNRFRKYYPEEKLVIIDAGAYRAVAKKKALIPNWK